MKLDKDVLVKQKFWVVLGAGVLFTLLALFALMVIVPSSIGKERAKVETGMKDIQGAVATAKNPATIAAAKEVADKEKAKETKVWGRAYMSQSTRRFISWPPKFDSQFEPENGLFATEITVQAKDAKLDDQPPDEPKEPVEAKKNEAKKDEANKEEAKKEEPPPAFAKFHGKVVAVDMVSEEFIEVQGRKGVTKKFRLMPRVKYTIPDLDMNKKAEFKDLAAKAGSIVAVTYFRGLRFGDPLTNRQQEEYNSSYLNQILDILKECGPVNELGQPVVQFPGYTYDPKDPKRPPPESPFLRYVAKFDTTKNISDAAWTAQEELGIQRELYRLVKQVNDSVANFQPVRDAKGQVVKGQFFNPYWQIDVEGVQPEQKKVKIKLTNRLDRTQGVNVNFLIQFKPGGSFVPIAPVTNHDPLPPAGSGKVNSLTTIVDIKGDGELGKEVVGVRQVLTWETAAVRRIDHISIGRSGDEWSLAQRNAYRKLKPFRKKPVEEKKEGDGADPGKGPMMPGGGAPMMPGGKVGNMPPGMGGAGQKAGDPVSGLVMERYFDITPQARRLPVALVLIVDQAHVSRVQTAFANSPLRFLINQAILNRYPNSLRPQTATMVANNAENPEGFFGGMPGMKGPGFPPGFPGGRPQMPVGGFPKMPPGGVPMMPKMPPGGMPPMMRNPGGIIPLNAQFPGMPGATFGDSATPSAGGSEEQESNIELVLYGIVSLYEPYPPRPPLPSAQDQPQGPGGEGM